MKHVYLIKQLWNECCGPNKINFAECADSRTNLINKLLRYDGVAQDFDPETDEPLPIITDRLGAKHSFTDLATMPLRQIWPILNCGDYQLVIEYF